MYIKKLFFICLLFQPIAIFATEITQVRLFSDAEKTRIVFDLSNSADAKVFTLDNPQRVVIDIAYAHLADSLNADTLINSEKLIGTPIRLVRAAQYNEHTLRIVLDLKWAVNPNYFILEEGGDKPDRLVVDLPALRDVIVFIDPGHGGKDPGAIGQAGTWEKTVVLAIAKQLQILIDRQPGMRTVLSRSDDRFIELRDRLQLAAQHAADIFVSIHADAASGSRSVQGASIYVLSEQGASREADYLTSGGKRKLILGDTIVEGSGDSLKNRLLAVVRQKNINPSLKIAKWGLQALTDRNITLLRNAPLRAGFMVLKSPHIPSLLVESGFISTPAEERKLIDPAYQRKVALALRAMLRCHFFNDPPIGTWLHSRKQATQYIVNSGDTLSEIAFAHQISTAHLRQANDITGDIIFADQVLEIPAIVGCS